MVNESYQMNPANYREALVEAHEDESEGADILLVGIAFFGTLKWILLMGNILSC
jgi:delta-aminolevulinic acid dehydratase/porphobilinogen synthase